MRQTLMCISVVLLVLSCQRQSVESRLEDKAVVSVSLPVEAYFVERLAGERVDVNVLVPQSAGHSDYSPLPSQMMELSRSSMYMAIGDLDFEIVWKAKMTSVNGGMRWVDLSEGIVKEEEEHDGHRHADPHYWLSPKQVRQMVRNMAGALKQVLPGDAVAIDSAAETLSVEIDSLDRELETLAGEKSISFMIYHPALTYVARDYGMSQYEIERDGNAPSPQTYMNEIELAKSAGVRAIFVQQGYDRQKAESAAQMIGARVVDFNPESREWKSPMETVIKALR